MKHVHQDIVETVPPPTPPRYVSMVCPACKSAVRVRCGRKSTALVCRCSCGKRYSYSCWEIRRNTIATYHKIEAFEIETDTPESGE